MQIPWMLPVLHFNSIKVRLKRKYNYAEYKKYWFQFHKGTIKTRSHCFLSLHKHYFNSIKVRLKQSSLMAILSISHFNSIKVRLKLSVWIVSTLICLLFQFHKGTIKTVSRIGHGLKFPDFNSIKVRLKLWMRPAHPVQFYFNSIKVRLKRNTFKSKVSFSVISIP